MAWALTQSGFSHDLAAAMAAVPGGGSGSCWCRVVAFTVLGSLLEGIPAIVLFGPLLFPIARQFGINDVHYSMVVILAMGLGLFAPPFGLCYYAACIIGQVAPEAGMRRIWVYLGLADGRADRDHIHPVDLDRLPLGSGPINILARRVVS